MEIEVMDLDVEKKNLIRRIYRKLSEDAKRTLKAWVRSRQAQLCETLPEIDGKAYLLAPDDRRVLVKNLFKELVPRYTHVGDYDSLSAGDKKSVEIAFNDFQSSSWKLEREKQAQELVAQEASRDTSVFDQRDFEVCKSWADVNEHLLIHKGTRTPCHTLDPLSVLEEKEALYGKEYRPEKVYLGYSPWEHPTQKLVHSENGNDIYAPFINKFRPSPWQEEGIISEATIPGPFRAFFKHLFADQVSREVVYCFLYRAIWGGNKTALVLNGAKGVGKNIFADICKGLVGAHNFRSAKRSILTKEFNIDLKDNLIFFLDEITAKTDESIAKLKSYLNDGSMSLEAKGVDARQYDLFNSFIINNNAPSDVTIGYDDRRYSVPDLGCRMLPEVWNDKQIDKFKELVDDVTGEHYRRLGSWLWENAPIDKYGPNYTHRGSRYRQMVLASLQPWQLHLLKKINDQTASQELAEMFEDEGIPLKDLRSGFPDRHGKWPSDTDTVEGWLDSFIDSDGKRIGQLREAMVVPDDAHDGDSEKTHMVYPASKVFVEGEESLLDWL